MWKRHKKELVGFVLTPIVIVILILIMVWIFEYFGIHVPGSREMWIGLIGAIIGGMCTFFGVLITIFRQEEAEREQKRLENMPILGFELGVENDDFDMILTYTSDGLITSGFPDFERMEVTCIKIKSVNGCPIFNFTIEGCSINGEEIFLTDAFNPSKSRIVAGEKISYIFNYAEELKRNIFCLVRFSYEDILGNRYYQDLPFIYMERSIPTDDKQLKQIIQIRDIKQSILSSKDMKSIKETNKEYIDYETFCKK